MKKLFLIGLIIIHCTKLLAQEEKYTSKEEDEYYRNWDSYVPFSPLDTSFILSFKSDFYEICEDETNYEPYSPEKITPFLDSILSKMSFHDYYKKLIESNLEMERVGKIYKDQILKYEKRDAIEAFIYYSYELENRYFGEAGIWIGYSENDGKDWDYYYTGIVQSQPVFVKYYSQRPLIKAKGKLEIDACLLRQLSPFTHPGPGPDFECIKEGIYLSFDINVISKDSDGDGLTDIVEEKLYTNKYNTDTDGDGVPDNLDTNPRVNFPRTEWSKIYEAILNDDIDWGKKGVGKLIFKENPTYFVTDATETVLIITDNEDLMGIRPKRYRAIFMKEDEYAINTKIYKSELNIMRFWPCFKVDNMRDTYKMTRSFNTWGDTYLIRKTKKGWTIEIISGWIF